MFHGAEPDEDRWDLMDPGPLDSWSVRGWYRPSPDMGVPGLAWVPDPAGGAGRRVTFGGRRRRRRWKKPRAGEARRR